MIAVAFASQAPTLGVAEFAPAAQRTVDAPPTTTAEVPGSAGARRRPTTTAPPPPTTATTSGDQAVTAPTTQVARSRPCVGNPPRQIEDPMSPACAATIFEGDNGGATTTGVTSTEIAIGIPAAGCDATRCQRRINMLFEYFNQRFELYGRRLRPVYVTLAHGDPVASRALGAEVAARQVFGALTGVVEWNGSAQSIFHELGRRGVVTIMRGTNTSDRLLLDELHPYLWTIQPSSEQWQRNLADFACTALAGHPASHAGNAALRAKTRKFGIIAAGNYETPSVQVARDALAACGVDAEVMMWNRNGSDDTTQLRTGLAALRAAGVTTITCVCSNAYEVYYSFTEAYTSGFAPEILTPLSSEPSWERWQTAPFMQSIFGISVQPKLLPVQAQSWHRALIAVDPTFSVRIGGSDFSAAHAQLTYDQLLVMASGIQSAGPHLTPESFAAGLMSARFPNTGAGAAPYWQPSVGFGVGDHSFVDDYAVTWWSNQADAVEAMSARAKGSWCYVDRGARASVGRFSSAIDELLFDPDQPCR